MALIPPKYLQAVVALGLRAAPEEAEETAQAMRELGTGFLYAYPSSEGQADSGFRLWLVTCKHVIEQAIKATNGDEILVRLNRSEHRGMQTFKISLRQGEGPDWTVHPTADVAVIATSWQDLETKGVQWETFAAGRNTLRREKAAEVGLSEGDETFVLGFPIGWRPGRQDYPIVRHGMLAQVQGWLRSEHDTYLVDGAGFPGNSGGPVVTKPQFGALEGTQSVPGGLLIGMVSRRELSDSPVEVGASVETANLIRVAETADLIEVIPMDLIDETVVLAMQSEESADKDSGEIQEGVSTGMESSQ